MAGWEVRIDCKSDAEKEGIITGVMSIVPDAQPTEMGPASSFVPLPGGFVLIKDSPEGLTLQITSPDARALAEKLKSLYPLAEISEIEKTQPNPQL